MRGPAQFTINAGEPRLAVHQEDLGAFVGDDWRVRPNITLSLGLRYETQTNIHDWRDFAPRVAVAWAPGGQRQESAPEDRAARRLRNFLRSLRAGEYYHGPPLQWIAATAVCHHVLRTFSRPYHRSTGLQAAPQVIEELSSNLRAPYIMQSSATMERQLPWNTTLAVTYTNSHGLHQLLTNDINAPLPGTLPSSPVAAYFRSANPTRCS